MSENPTGGEQDFVAPETMPPAGPEAPVMPATPAVPEAAFLPPEPSGPPKRKLDVAFFILGFVTPWLVGVLVSASVNALGDAGAALGATAGGLPLAVIVAQLVAWIVGRRNGNNRLRSWGLGGVISVAVAVLAGLLFFGACMLTVGGSGLLG